MDFTTGSIAATVFQYVLAGFSGVPRPSLIQASTYDVATPHVRPMTMFRPVPDGRTQTAVAVPWSDQTTA